MFEELGVTRCASFEDMLDRTNILSLHCPLTDQTRGILNADTLSRMPEIVAEFAKLPVANLSDSMSRMTAAGHRLRPMHSSGSMAGVALTVKARPGDNLMLHAAIDRAVPGDVIVVGFVIDGAIRDLDNFRETNLPTWAAGVTHRGPYKDGPGEVNVPIAIDGMVIHPGDIMVGDSDGVLCVPIDEAETILKSTQAKSAAEIKQMADIEAGTNDRTWVDRALKDRGCQMTND